MTQTIQPAAYAGWLEDEIDRLRDDYLNRLHAMSDRKELDRDPAHMVRRHWSSMLNSLMWLDLCQQLHAFAANEEDTVFALYLTRDLPNRLRQLAAKSNLKEADEREGIRVLAYFLTDHVANPHTQIRHWAAHHMAGLRFSNTNP